MCLIHKVKKKFQGTLVGNIALPLASINQPQLYRETFRIRSSSIAAITVTSG